MEKYSDGVTPEPQDTERQLLVKILTALNSGSGGGGGSGGIQGAQADYSGGAPNWTPTGTNIGVAIDTVTTQLWWYYGGQWQ